MSIVAARSRAREIRQQIADEGRVFTKSEFRAAVLAACADLAPTALEGLVDGAVNHIDKAFIGPSSSSQLELFPLQGDYALDEDRRVAKRYARAEHMEAVLRIDDQNRDRVLEANQRKHREYTALLPYWGPGVSKEQAVNAYRAAHPETGDEVQ